ncbi:MAG: AI-2E family transporter [Halovenus sp.]
MDRARGIIGGLIGTLFVLAVLLVLPFLEYFLLAVLLAYALRPIQQRYERRLGPRITAGWLVIGSAIAIILPVLWLLRIVIRETTRFVRRVRSGDITFTQVETWIFDLTGEEVDILGTIDNVIRDTGIGTLNGALGVFGTITNLSIGIALTLFLLYYFLKDGDKFNHWLRMTVPLPGHIQDDLQRELHDVVWAVLLSHVLIAVIQGAVAGAGLIVLGVPNAIFWTMVMIILAVLPIIGSFLVWGPAAIYLFSVGRPVAGGALLVYGAIVVSFSDDFLRPLIIERHTENRLNPGAIVLGILGGVYVVGFIGIFFGPVIIGSLRAVLDIYRREYVEETSTKDTTASDGAEMSESRVEPTPGDETQSGPQPHGTTGSEE